MVLLCYSCGILIVLLGDYCLWCCCGDALVLRLYCCGIDVDSCGIDVEFPMALLGHCCEIAGGLLGYYYYDGIALGLLRYCCDLAVGFL